MIKDIYEDKKITPRQVARDIVINSIINRYHNGIYHEAAENDYPEMTEREKNLVFYQIKKLVAKITA